MEIEKRAGRNSRAQSQHPSWQMQTAGHCALAASLFGAHYSSGGAQLQSGFSSWCLMTPTVTAAEAGAGNLSGREIVGIQKKNPPYSCELLFSLGGSFRPHTMYCLLIT